MSIPSCTSVPAGLIILIIALLINPVVMIRIGPQPVAPIKYEIKIDPNISEKRFNATIMVEFVPQKTVSNIVLKLGDYTLDNVELYGTEGFELLYYTKRNLIILLEQPYDHFFHGQTYTLQIMYSGNFRQDNKGFYLSNYTTSSGTVVDYVATGFRGQNFHLGFPYFEIFETYAIPLELLVRNQGEYTVVASSWSVGNQNAKEDEYIHFDHPSVLQMSLFIGKFGVSMKKNGTCIRVFYREGDDDTSNSSTFAVEVGSAVLKSAEEYLGQKYPLEKIDSVIVPELPASTTDSLSLVFYTDYVDILLSSKTFDELALEQEIRMSTLHKIVLTISQKMSFQFFGGMMEPQGMMDTKIIRALGDFVSYKVLENTYPELSMTMDLLYLDSVHRFFWEEARSKNFVLVPSKYKPNSVRKRKIVALLRMFYDICDEVLARTLKKILYSKSTSSGVQMLETMEEEYGFNESYNMFKQWNETVGYPVVYFQGINGEIRVNQWNFSSGETSKWYFPVSILAASDDEVITIPLHYMITSKMTFKLDETIDWFLASPGRSVPYRVNYDKENWYLLIQRLKSHGFGGVPYINRAQLLDDSMALAHAGYTTYDLPFELAEYLSNEHHFLPWTVAHNNFKFIYQRLEGYVEQQKELQKFVVKLVEGIWEMSSSGFTSDTLLQIAIEWACLPVGGTNQRCMEHVHEVIKRVTSNPYKELPTRTRDAICCAALRSHERTMLRQMWHFRGNTSDERDFWLRCHACSYPLVVSLSFRDSLHNEREYLLDEEIPRLQKYFFENADTDSLVHLIGALRYFAHEIQCTTFARRSVYLDWLHGLIDRMSFGLADKIFGLLNDLRGMDFIKSEEKRELRSHAKRQFGYIESHFKNIPETFSAHNNV